MVITFSAASFSRGNGWLAVKRPQRPHFEMKDVQEELHKDSLKEGRG
jgi:hypothetical protein